jgi:hypothetical protein
LTPKNPQGVGRRSAADFEGRKAFKAIVTGSFDVALGDTE